MSCSRETC